MSSERSYLRYWLDGGRAWVTPGFDFPMTWHVQIPKGSDRAVSEPIESLDDAVRLADAAGVDLDVDEWTYALMVRCGLAPPTRPSSVTSIADPYPGSGIGEDERPARLKLIEQARGFMDLPAEDAQAEADRRNLHARIFHELPAVMTLEYAPLRLTFWLRDGRVSYITTG